MESKEQTIDLKRQVLKSDFKQTTLTFHGKALKHGQLGQGVCVCLCVYLSLRKLSLKMISNVSPNCVRAALSSWIPLR